MTKKISLLCFLILFSTHLFAQEEDIEISPISFENIGSITAISGMAQDEKGHIWMTENGVGILRYDGKNMITYRPEADNGNSIVAGRLEDILIDKNGFIWIGSFGQGLDKLDPESDKFIHLRHDPNKPSSIRSNGIRAILEDEEGFLWIGTDDGLDRLDPLTGEFTHVFSDDPDAETLGKEHIRTLYLDKEGIIWIGTGSPFYAEETQGGLFSYDRKTGEIVHYLHSEENNSLIDNRVGALFEDSRGVFWVGTAGDGLHTMDREKGIFTRHEYDPENPQKLSRPALNDIHAYGENHIRFINEDELGNIWMGTFENGINKYDPKTQIIRHFGQAEFNSNSFWESLKTQDGLLWFSSWQPNNSDNVLFKIDSSPRKVDLLDLGSTAYSFLENEDGSFYIGTNDGLVYLDTDNKIQNIAIYDQNRLVNTRVYNLRMDEKGNLWLHTFNGLYIYDPNAKKVIKSFLHDPNNIHSISSDSVVTSIQVNENTVLVSSANGFNVLDLETEVFRRYYHDPNDNNSISESSPSNIFKDSNNNNWIGTRDGGLNLFNLEEGSFKRYENFDRVFVIFEDSKARLWLGDRGSGLRLYDKEKDSFVLFLDNSGLLNSYFTVYGMTEDHDGLLWLNSSIGYIRLNPENGDSFLFGQSWGINQATNDSDNGYTSSNGDVLFGYGNGFFQFEPEKYKVANDYNPSPFLGKFYIDNQVLVAGETAILKQPLSETSQVTLDYTQNNFAFDYGYINHKTNAYEDNVNYKLENYEDAWRSNDGNNKASYYQVSPGKYVFRIRASNINGTWEEKAITIIILPPWYQTWWAYTLFALLAAGSIRAFVVYRSRKLKAENKILEEKVVERTTELHEAKTEVEKSLESLKSTQAQLIQSEKMASLGELTAGIAHEIQNPLNFVNNFSELNSELLEELEEEINLGNFEEVKNIAKDLNQNEKKINEHGKRASGIVKGMLEHSKSSSGKKELTDINALANEFLKLSYGSMIAKDESFKADFKMNFEESLPKIEVVSQDIGRVLLNLINNAFQATSDEALKRKLNSDENEAKSGSYKPTVTVSTKSENNQIMITVKDNGSGIPPEIKDKIFQPFFTTRDTGKGTGLGLSLAYDIVKAHGGELTVKSTPAGRAGQKGETEFLIQIPFKN